jgi:hypothetical protein
MWCTMRAAVAQSGALYVHPGGIAGAAAKGTLEFTGMRLLILIVIVIVIDSKPGDYDYD